jgi:FkbM family methyltransferase
MISSLKKRARRRVKELGRKLTEVFGAARQPGLEDSANQDENSGVVASHDPSMIARQARDPIYAGSDRAFVKVASGQFVCVDTNSLDAIDYLLGFEIEQNIVPVFRRFLTPKSVVLDIGANFGYYTVVAGTWLKDQGRLYSFEANPHTFGLLRRSVYANRLLNKPHIKLVNALVGSSSGKATLYFNPEELGGATMTDTDHWGDKRRSAELPMITIDDALPSDLAIDLVKIDVEGHEPAVIKGMELTIVRSPNIRIIVEWFDHMIEGTFGSQRFAEYIDALGFRICRIRHDATLELLERGTAPMGENYCLLTRSPEADIARQYFSIPADCLHYHDQFKPLLNNGVFCFLASSGFRGDLFYGPYINLEAGRYVISFEGELCGKLGILFSCDRGHPISDAVISDFSESITIDVPNAENFEIVAKQTNSLASLTLRAINIQPLRG